MKYELKSEKKLHVEEDWIKTYNYLHATLTRWCSCKESTYLCRRHKRLGFNLWVRKILWRGKWQLTPLFLPGKFQGQRSLGATVHGIAWQVTVHGGHKEMNMTKQLSMYVLRNLNFISQSMESL